MATLIGTPQKSTGYGPIVLAAATPVCTTPVISGNKWVGAVLTATYVFSDVNGDLEGDSTFTWFRADDAAGTNSVAIDGATSTCQDDNLPTYTLTAEDVGKYIQCEVTPVALTENPV